MEKLEEWDAFELIVQRKGNVLSGYITRMIVIVLSVLACRKNTRAWVSYMGCGIGKFTLCLYSYFCSFNIAR
jgi:hypothetical protein